MIIKNSSIFSKKQRSIIVIVSFLFDVAIFAIVIISFFIGYSSNVNTEKNNYIVAILAAVGMVSFGDMLVIFSKRKSIPFLIFRAFKKINDALSQIGIEINTMQLQFCEAIVGRKSDKRLIYIHGNKNKGKSTAVLFLLKVLLLNSDSINDIPWYENITFIDCSNNKDEIINFFLMNEPVLNRIKRFNNCLIILDNIECLGSIFLEENINLFSSYRSFFILIEDTHSPTPMVSKDMLEEALCVYDFNPNVISVRESLNLYKELIDFDSMTKNVFFALYFSTLNSYFVQKKNIRKVLSISRQQFHKSFKKIQKLKIFVSFPYNTSYCYCCKKRVLENIDKQFSEDLIYNSVLKVCIFSNLLNAENKWLCLIRSAVSTIELVEQEKRQKMFHKALYNGNYTGLYNELEIAINNNSSKRTLFLYEKAFLSFHIGNHEEAANCYTSLINLQPDINKKKELILHIIECTHGNPDQTNMHMINNMITELKVSNDFYSVCARYWEVHILSEKGIFSLDNMKTIRKNISKYTHSCNTSLQRSILHRTFTDEIRFNHILGNDQIFSLYDEYSNFLLSCGKVRQEYYNNLYIEANYIHYISIMNIVLYQNAPTSLLEEYVETADHYYEQALKTEYNDEKSKRATRVKQADLRMMYWNFNYEETIQTINLFRVHSQINHVGVHEAYCETLLIKALILHPHNISNESGIHIPDERLKEIYLHFDNSKKIFEKYQNNYGIFRLMFIVLLLELLISDLSTEDLYFKAIQDLRNSNPQYTKESKIIDELIQRRDKDYISKFFIISIIKAYPIILQ